MPQTAPAPIPFTSSPNALADYNAAEALAYEGEEQTVAEGSPWRVKTRAEAEEASNPTSYYHVFTLPELDKLVARNAPALALFAPRHEISLHGISGRVVQ